MKILVHCCCAPCTIYPLEIIGKFFDEIELLFYNPNIHPFTEYRLRLDTLKQMAREDKLYLHVPEEYDLKPFFQSVVFNESARCKYCYDLRLKYASEYASKNGFGAFTTSLLYSKYQNHSLMVELAKKYAEQNGIEFFYHDFREGWQQGIDTSIERKMYRQKYCGCLYSEQERFDNRWKKRQIKLIKSRNQQKEMIGKKNG